MELFVLVLVPSITATTTTTTVILWLDCVRNYCLSTENNISQMQPEQKEEIFHSSIIFQVFK